MKHLIKILFVFIFSLILIGCECYPVKKGIIVDEVTHMPIENAQIEFGSSKTLSNANGQFEISANGCDWSMTVTKQNYKPFGASLSTGNNKVSIRVDNQTSYKDLERPGLLNSDSTSTVEVKTYLLNSIHFEYFGATDSLKIYLEKK